MSSLSLLALSFLAVGPSLTMMGQSKKSRTACLLVRVETWALRQWTMRSGDLEAWITEAGPCPSARKFSSVHHHTHCFHSQYQLQHRVVSSAQFDFVTCTQRILVPRLSIPKSLPRCSYRAQHYTITAALQEFDSFIK